MEARHRRPLGLDLGQDRRSAVLAAELLELPLPADHPEGIRDRDLETRSEVAAAQVDGLQAGVGDDRRPELERRIEGFQLLHVVGWHRAHAFPRTSV